jgi:hypothetical protein
VAFTLPLIALFVSFVMPTVALFMSSVMLIAVILAVTRLIVRHVDIIIPLIMHEIDGSVTSLIFAAVLAPVFLMTGRYVQVDWLIRSTGTLSNHDRSRVNEFGLRSVSNVNAAIKSWLADADRHTDISCLCRDGKKDYHDGEQNMFHAPLFFTDV